MAEAPGTEPKLLKIGLLGAVWPRLLALDQNCSTSNCWELLQHRVTKFAKIVPKKVMSEAWPMFFVGSLVELNN